MELNDDGYYVPVEVHSSNYVATGGVYQLKQVFHWFFWTYI